MSRINTPQLTESAKVDLLNRFRSDPNHTLRMRCQLILLKAEGRDSKEVASIVKSCEMTVNNWVKRYKQEGIAGLMTKPGRGRRAIIRTPEDRQVALEAIKADRQRLQTAKAEWEAKQGKTVSRDTFRRFLKSMVDATNASASE
jgi:transposase